jgi:hypothetical protein
MNQFAAYGTTDNDNYFEWLYKYTPWITEHLGVANPDDLIRFTRDTLTDISQPLLKKTVCAGQDSVITGRISRIAEGVGAKITSATLHPSLSNRILNFTATKANADWIIDTSHIIALLQFDGLKHPLVFVRCEVQPASRSWSNTAEEFICAKSALHEVVAYLQAIERQVQPIMLKSFDDLDMHEIQPLKWADLSIDENIDEMVRQDFTSFLTEKKQKWFKTKKLPYRRGYLLHGPPGNGKTSLIRAMLTEAKLPAYTMKKFASEQATGNFEEMFNQASRNERAIIILEDIDRSFSSKGNEKDSDTAQVSFSTFLNCLDGVGNSDGLILIATANNPKNLDMAILERPGRFDRVVNFPNPSNSLRLEYFMRLNPTFNPLILEKLLESSPSMSFAQLKEVYILGYQFAEKANREDLIEEDLEKAIKGMSKMLSVKSSAVGWNK